MYYGEKNYSIKPNNDIINLSQEEEENEIIEHEHEHEHEDSHENQLIKLAKSLNPKHGDKLYPLEILGVYKIIHSNLEWNYKYGNPESFIDSKIFDFLISIDLHKFRNRLEREISENLLVKHLFGLRLNYAYLLKSGMDTIEIRRNKDSHLLFQDQLDIERNYIGQLSSASELSDTELDELADKFYKNKEKISEKQTGTPQNLRDKIKFLLNNSGIEIIENLDKVYYELNKLNKENIECGLIARVAYLAFVSEINLQQSTINNFNPPSNIDLH